MITLTSGRKKENHLEQLPESLRQLARGLDLKALASLKDSLDQEKMGQIVTGMLKTLQKAVPESEYRKPAAAIEPLIAIGQGQRQRTRPTSLFNRL